MLPFFLYSSCLLVSLLVSLHFFKSSRSAWIDRLTLALIPPFLTSFVFLLIYKIHWSIYYDMNWERLFTPLVLARGHSIYPLLDKDPALVSLYGPVSVLSFLPAALGSTPMAAMRIAESLCIAFFYLPAMGLHLGKRDEGPRAFRILVFLIFAFFPFLVSSLRNAAFNVHADAPTLGLATLACAALYLRKKSDPWMDLFASSFFAVLSVWSKQVALPLLFALPLYVWRVEGHKIFLRYLTCLFISGVLISLPLILVFDDDRLYLNLIVIPLRQPLKEGGFLPALILSVLKLLRELALILPLGFFTLSALKTKKHPWMLFFFIAVLMIPMSLLSYMKIGGSNNTLSYVTFFFLIGSTLAWADQSHRPTARIAALLLGSIFLAIQIPSVYYRIAKTSTQSDFAQVAFDYMKKHPGEGYFPRFGVLSLLAEDEVYHSSVALKDRHWAGFPIGQDHFKAHIPKNIRLVAFHYVTADDMPWLHLADFSVVSSEDELPGYYLFKRPPPS